MSRHKLTCISMEGCTGSFSVTERNKFMTEALIIAMDRLELEDRLRNSQLVGLVSCPFCPYVAEYPPIQEEEEFKCSSPSCGRLSCRHCRSPSHLPKACESRKFLATRRIIEEAESAAIIRNCNNCKSRSGIVPQLRSS